MSTIMLLVDDGLDTITFTSKIMRIFLQKLYKIFTKFVVHAAYGCGSDLRRHCNMLCTSSCIDMHNILQRLLRSEPQTCYPLPVVWILPSVL